MGKVIAIGNLKGGTGKSTIAVNLACALAEDNADAILIDADGQGTTTDWHAGDRLPVEVESLPLGLERNAQAWVARVLALKAGRDLVLVDLPPQVGSGIASALLIADLFVIPITPSGVDLRATGKALDLLRRARAVRGAGHPGCLLVPSRVDRRTAIGRRIQLTLERFGLDVAPGIRQRAAHIEAFEAGTWVGAYAPGSLAHLEVRALAKCVAARMREMEEAAGSPVTMVPQSEGEPRPAQVATRATELPLAANA